MPNESPKPFSFVLTNQILCVETHKGLSLTHTLTHTKVQNRIYMLKPNPFYVKFKLIFTDSYIEMIKDKNFSLYK